MKKRELLKLLAQYDDDQEVLVEAPNGGFDDPVAYVTAVRGREGHEFAGRERSEYLYDAKAAGFGVLVLGTTGGLVRLG